ncbi:MAG: glycosyltransferase [Cellulosilyticaceae bacterium]
MHWLLFILFFIFEGLYLLLPLFLIKPKKVDSLTSLHLKDLPEEGMSVLIPAYNEKEVIYKCVDSIIQANYSNYEIIIINDGSTDSTLDILKEHFQLYPITRSCAGQLTYQPVKAVYQSQVVSNVIVIDKYNGGKADSLNAGIDYSSKEVMITLDADSMIEKDSLKYINQSFEDPHVIGVGGMVHIVQGFNPTPEGYKLKNKRLPALVHHQITQYLKGFYLNKYTQSHFNAITVIAGAFGAFKKDVLFTVNGFRQTVGEDMDITLKIQKYMHQHKAQKLKMRFTPQAICYTQCPSDMNNLLHQRFRWQRAFIDCVFCYWDDLFTNLSTATSLYLLFDSLILGTIGAFFAITWASVILLSPGDNWTFVVLLFVFTSILSVLQNLCSIIIMRRFNQKYSLEGALRLILFGIFDVATFRLLGILYATLGSCSYFWNTHGWKKITRVEFQEEAVA